MLTPSPAIDALPQIEDPALAEFMARYFTGDSIRLKPPANNVLADARGVVSIVLFREGQFQVEMIVLPPNINVPPHYHDDVDSFEVGISGSQEFFIAGVQSGFLREPRANGMSRDFGRFVPIRSDAFHGARTGPHGATFLSVQRWRDGVTPTHVGLNWREPC